MLSRSGRFVAATTLTLIGICVVPPTRVSFLSSSTRSSFTCVDGRISPISSRKSVPSSASSNRPMRRSAAPVNAPFSWPNSSLSISDSGSAPAFTAMNGFPRRGLSLWIACATSSFPVPLSPSMITVLETGAICSILSSTSPIASDCPIRPVASVRRLRSRTRRTARYNSSAVTGFVYTSVNPMMRRRSRS